MNRISYGPVKKRKARRIKLSLQWFRVDDKNRFEEKSRSLILEIIVLGCPDIRWSC